MERTKTIYFFGAGASIAESPLAPTGSALLRGGLEGADGRYETLRRFLGEWGYPGYERLPTIEELLSILDFCLSKGEPIGQKWSISDLARCREELLACIYDYISQTARNDGNGHEQQSLYLGLLKDAPAATSLISLNYDLLLDRAIYKLGRTPDYSLDFLDVQPPDQPCEFTQSGAPMRVFKLHGSLNWGYCPSCFTTLFSYLQKLSPTKTCPTCGGMLSALLVPPTPMKVPPSPFLSALWKKAEWELAQACAMVFIGYSLGDADANIRYLLFRGFFGYVPQVTVVQKQATVAEDEAVVGRYNRLFPGGVTFFWGGFEEYLSR